MVIYGVNSSVSIPCFSLCYNKGYFPCTDSVISNITASQKGGALYGLVSSGTAFTVTNSIFRNCKSAHRGAIDLNVTGKPYRILFARLTFSDEGNDAASGQDYGDVFFITYPTATCLYESYFPSFVTYSVDVLAKHQPSSGSPAPDTLANLFKTFDKTYYVSPTGSSSSNACTSQASPRNIVYYASLKHSSYSSYRAQVLLLKGTSSHTRTVRQERGLWLYSQQMKQTKRHFSLASPLRLRSSQPALDV